MELTIHSTFLPHNDPDAALGFYRDTLGFEVRKDVDYGGLRWITVGPPGQPETSIVLTPPAITPGITDEERRTLIEMMAKGTYGMIILASRDLREGAGQRRGSDPGTDRPALRRARLRVPRSGRQPRAHQPGVMRLRVALRCAARVPRAAWPCDRAAVR